VHPLSIMNPSEILVLQLLHGFPPVTFSHLDLHINKGLLKLLEGRPPRRVVLVLMRSALAETRGYMPGPRAYRSR